MPPRTGAVRSSGLRRLLVALALLATVVAAAVAAAWVATPQPAALAARVAAQLRTTGGRPVSPASIPAVLRHAVVSTEDERFYHHHGIDLIGVVRALPYDVTHLSFAQGASTITEQVAKLLYLHGNDHNPWRKLEDAALAWKIEDRYTKAQILAAYLNSAYFGEHAYGIGAASERYFGIPPQRLDVAQASLLAGLVQAPSAYNPYRDPTLARERQAEVLRSLVRTGYLSVGEATRTLARPLRLRRGTVIPPLHGADLAPGPAFLWWQLVLGTTLVLAAAAALAGARSGRRRLPHGMVVVRLVLLALLLIGAAAIVRSFRTA